MVKVSEALIEAVFGVEGVDNSQWTQGTWNNFYAMVEMCLREQNVDWGF